MLLQNALNSFQFGNSFDGICWQLTPSGDFTTSSLYQLINTRGIKWELANSLWKLKLPSKVKCCIWLGLLNKLNTRENHPIKIGANLEGCLFCDDLVESIKHMFTMCPFVATLWNAFCSSLSIPIPVHDLWDHCTK